LSKYLKKKIEQAQEIIKELEAYFEGDSVLKNNSKNKRIYFDKKDNSYILPSGVNEDEIFNYLENSKNDKIYDGLVSGTEVLELPKLKEGNIRKRKDGRWESRYYYEGTQHSVYARTQKECISKLKQALKDRDQAEKSKIVSNNITLNKWVEIWLDLYKSEKKFSTLKDYQLNLVNKLNKHPLGKKQVSKIVAIDIEKFLLSIKSPASRARTYRQLKSCFHSLTKKRIIKYDPFDVIEPISEPKTNGYSPTTKELNYFLKRLKDSYFEIYLFSYFISLTGLRKGEALALTWEDLKENKIRINKAYERHAKKIQSTKTKTSNRIIPLFPEVKKLLMKIKEYSDGNLVFSFIYNDAVSSRFNIYTKRFGLPNLTLHSLRHYFATQCLEAGIERKVVQKWLGHSNYRTTSDIYSHINTEYEDDQAKILSMFRQKAR